MKAMLYAEWLILKQTVRTIGIILLFFSVMTVISGQTSFAAMLVMMFSIMLPSTLFTSEQAYGWHHLRLSLPILRQDIVSSRFLMSILANAGIFLLSCMLIFISYGISGVPENFQEEVSGLLLCEAVSLVMAGTLITIAFKWGIAKARYIVMAGIWIPFGVILTLKKVGNFTFSLPEPPTWFIIVIVCVSLLIYFGCYLLSACLYRKTEF